MDAASCCFIYSCFIYSCSIYSCFLYSYFIYSCFLYSYFVSLHPILSATAQHRRAHLIHDLFATSVAFVTARPQPFRCHAQCSWQDWFAGDPDFETGATSPFNYTKSPANEPTGFVHLLRHGVDIGQSPTLAPVAARAFGCGNTSSEQQQVT